MSGTPAAAEKPAPPPPAKTEEKGFVPLFNGKGFTGWKTHPSQPGNWRVENGVLTGSSDGVSHLYTDRGDYKDFHLALKFKCEGDGNSGVFFHSEFKPRSVDIVKGMQFEIDCTIGKHTAGLYGDGRQWLVWPSPENETVVRKGEWNEYLLKVEGNRYQARLNGVQMIDFTDPAPRSFDGGISLQLHSGGGGDMRFRDIWIRDLSVREAPKQ